MASPTFSASLDVGRRLFEAARFHAAHEAWEAGWRRTSGDEKQVLQALVLWAAALHHHAHGKELGATRLLHRALERLAGVEDDFSGVDLDALREGLVTSLERAQTAWCSEARPAWPCTADGVVTQSLDHETCCPYCGEAVTVSVAPEEADDAQYVEDCPVCCRPWQVQLTRDGAGFHVTLGRDDAQ
jgi:hypothetical protein